MAIRYPLTQAALGVMLEGESILVLECHGIGGMRIVPAPAIIFQYYTNPESRWLRVKKILELT